MAKDLSASSFASYLKCQRCSFEVYYRSHAVQALTLAYLQKKVHTVKAQKEIGAALVKKRKNIFLLLPPPPFFFPKFKRNVNSSLLEKLMCQVIVVFFCLSHCISPWYRKTDCMQSRLNPSGRHVTLTLHQ